MSVILRDYQHASRLFVSDNQKFAAKPAFLFHVYFGINKKVVTDKYIVEKFSNELGMLVKNVSLPTFKLKVDTKNQYNRKKNIQYTHEYDDIILEFHDDNANLITDLWKNYYQYYYADPSTAKQPNAYDRNATLKYSYMKNPYGLNNNSKIPFFRYIKLYQLSRGKWFSYTLLNPLIIEFGHPKMNYEEYKPCFLTMKLKYEAVSYESGSVDGDEPFGFAKTHYDLSKSPLEDYSQPLVAPPTINTPVPTAVQQESFNNAIKANTTYVNTNNVNVNTAVQSVISMDAQTITGFNTIIFPRQLPADNTTIATLIKL